MRTIGSICSGVGGLELGLEIAKLGRTVWQIEIERFCRQVLAKNWPNVKRYEDVKKVRTDDLERVDVVCAGFPCQPVAYAGHKRSDQDERWLWPDVARIIEGLSPQVVIGENVPGLRDRGLERIRQDLQDMGYSSCWVTLGCWEAGMPHGRDRIFIVAHRDPNVVVGIYEEIEAERAHSYDLRERCEVEPTAGVHANGQPWNDLARRHGSEIARWARICGTDAPKPVVRRMDDGPIDRSHRARIRALGNAVAPPVAEIVGRAVLTVLDNV